MGEEIFESLNVFQACVSSSFCLSSLSLSTKLCCGKVRCRLDAKKKRKMVRRCFYFRAREMEQNRTDAIAGRDSSRVSVDAEGFALPSSSKFGFFLFFLVRWCSVRCARPKRAYICARDVDGKSVARGETRSENAL